MEASDISSIVYQLVRLKDDRNGMMHEDTLSQFIARIADLKSKNRKLIFQL